MNDLVSKFGKHWILGLWILAGLGAAFWGVPRVHAQASPPPSSYQPVLDRLQSMTVVPLEEWRVHSADLSHPEDPNLDDSGWKTVKGATSYHWARTHPVEIPGPAWFRREIEIPKLTGGLDITGARLRLQFGVGSAGNFNYRLRVFFNGNMVAQQDQDTSEPILITEKAQPGQKVVAAIGMITPPDTLNFGGAALLVDFPARGVNDPYTVLFQIRAAEAMLAAFPAAKVEHGSELDAAAKAIDFPALDRGDQQAFQASLQAANDKLQPVGQWMKQYQVFAVANSHIDMAWLWPWTETVEVVRNTFGTALQLMREYPDFIYAHSSAQTYVWMEEKYPDMFKDIQQRVKEGRWEIVGGMWVEPDLNMPSGESLARQILIGKRYFEQKFGVDVRIGWNPDSFGYNWQLPQIYKRSGLDYFITQKMEWNDTTKFPHKLFWWQSPDGSKVLTYFPHDYVNTFDPDRIASDVAEWSPQTGFPGILHMYGMGDHGGGATRTMLDDALRLQNPKLAFPTIKFTTAQSFFDALEKDTNLKIPTWNNEMYFEFHRGVMTTQSETKKEIRSSEELLLNAEKFSSMATLYGLAYPQQELEDAWKKVLFDQFHDIMPGSGIAVNYLDAKRDLGVVTLVGSKALGEAQERLAAHVDTRGAGVPVVVFNSLNWSRTDPVEATVEFPGPVKNVEVRDTRGKTLISTVVSRDNSDHTVTVRFLATDVPPLGYEVVHVVEAGKSPKPKSTLQAGADSIENEFVRVKADPKTGCITSLFDKKANREALAPGACGNQLQAFRDKPKQWDAWNIDADFENQKWDLAQPQEANWVETAPDRAVIHLKQKFQNSTFTQDVVLYPGVPRVDVNTKADWHEKHILIKAAFPVSVQSDFATYEIPYGSIKRPTTRNTPAEKAMFEVPAFQWGDLSGSAHGFSLLNASKYGYDAKGNVIRLSLLRAPDWPDPHADDGYHEFTYSLYPHPGDWKQGGTERQAYQLNYPLLAISATSHEGSLPISHSFVKLDALNVILTGIKKAEDGDGIVFHFYEFDGQESQVRLELPAAASRAAETNLVEKEENSLTLADSGKTVGVSIHPYEIKAVEVWFEKH